jgi:hypothetical protein
MKKLFSLLAAGLLFSACTTPISTLEVPEIDPDAPVLQTYSEVNIALIAIDPDGAGDIGCGDTVELVTLPASGTGNEAKVQSALEELFGITDQNYGESGLYNALYQSSLSVENILWDGTNLAVDVTGSMTSGGVCDDPRIEAQILRTVAENAPTGAKITVAIDDEGITEYFNLSGL